MNSNHLGVHFGKSFTTVNGAQVLGDFAIRVANARAQRREGVSREWEHRSVIFDGLGSDVIGPGGWDSGKLAREQEDHASRTSTLVVDWREYGCGRARHTITRF